MQSPAFRSIARSMVVALAVGACWSPLMAAPSAIYERLEERLGVFTAQQEVTDPSNLSVGNFADADNPQTINFLPGPRYDVTTSNLGAVRILFQSPGNNTRAYFSGAAILLPGGGVWSSFERNKPPPLHPEFTRPDLLIGPPPGLMAKQVPTWDVIPLNVSGPTGTRLGIFQSRSKL